MANVKALRIEKLTFILPDTFVGDEHDALKLVLDYMIRKSGRSFETPTNPRANARKATIETLEGGGRLNAVMGILTLDVPEHLVKAQFQEKQTVVIPSIVIP